MAMASCRLPPTPTRLPALLESQLLDVVLVEIKAKTVDVVVVVDETIGLHLKDCDDVTTSLLDPVFFVVICLFRTLFDSKVTTA